jgi:hypothetical protein
MSSLPAGLLILPGNPPCNRAPSPCSWPFGLPAVRRSVKSVSFDESACFSPCYQGAGGSETSFAGLALMSCYSVTQEIMPGRADFVVVDARLTATAVNPPTLFDGLRDSFAAYAVESLWPQIPFPELLLATGAFPARAQGGMADPFANDRVDTGPRRTPRSLQRRYNRSVCLMWVQCRLLPQSNRRNLEAKVRHRHHSIDLSSVEEGRR